MQSKPIIVFLAALVRSACCCCCSWNRFDLIGNWFFPSFIPSVIVCPIQSNKRKNISWHSTSNREKEPALAYDIIVRNSSQRATCLLPLLRCLTVRLARTHTFSHRQTDKQTEDINKQTQGRFMQGPFPSLLLSPSPTCYWIQFLPLPVVITLSFSAVFEVYRRWPDFRRQRQGLGASVYMWYL